MTPSPPPIVGVLGHRGHGKSTLSVALLRRLLSRGWEITPVPTHQLGEVEKHPHPFWYHCSNADSTLLLVDCPRPSNDWLVSVLPALDGAIVVVDANRGIESQTRDLIVLARQAGVTSLVGFLTCVDLASDSLADEVELDLRRLMHLLELPGDDVPIVRGDAFAALLGEGSDEQSCELDRLFEAIRAEVRPHVGEADAPLLLPVGRGSTILWRDIPLYRRVLGEEQRCRLFGRVAQGTVRVGDLVEVVAPWSRTMLRVGHLIVFGDHVEASRPGDAVEIVLLPPKSILGEDLPHTGPGCVIAAPGTICFPRRFRARIVLHPRPELGTQSLGNGTLCSFLIGTANVHGTVDLDGRPQKARLATSEPALVTVTLHAFCHFVPGQTFSMKHRSGVLAAGTVLEILDVHLANP